MTNLTPGCVVPYELKINTLTKGRTQLLAWALGLKEMVFTSVPLQIHDRVQTDLDEHSRSQYDPSQILKSFILFSIIVK